MIAETIKKKNKGGRPKGSKTRPDAPSKLKKLHAVRDSKGHFIPATTQAVGTTAAPADNPMTGGAATKPAASPETRPDTELFGETPDFEKKQLPGLPDGNPENAESTGTSDQSGTADQSGAGDEKPPEPESTAESQRPLATVCWDTIVQLLAMTIGTFWFPRKVGDNAAAGEIPFDEREMVITAFCEYFHSVGVAILSPVQKLWLAILAYSMPRLGMTMQWLKTKFAKKKKVEPKNENDARFAKTEKPAEDLKSAKTGENPPPVEPSEISGI